MKVLYFNEHLRTVGQYEGKSGTLNPSSAAYISPESSCLSISIAPRLATIASNMCSVRIPCKRASFDSDWFIDARARSTKSSAALGSESEILSLLPNSANALIRSNLIGSRGNCFMEFTRKLNTIECYYSALKEDRKAAVTLGRRSRGERLP